jgi:hypothetical protein
MGSEVDGDGFQLDAAVIAEVPETDAGAAVEAGDVVAAAVPWALREAAEVAGDDIQRIPVGFHPQAAGGGTAAAVRAAAVKPLDEVQDDFLITLHRLALEAFNGLGVGLEGMGFHAVRWSLS